MVIIILSAVDISLRTPGWPRSTRTVDTLKLESNVCVLKEPRPFSSCFAFSITPPQVHKSLPDSLLRFRPR